MYLYFIPLIFYTSYYRKNEETLNGKLLVSAMFETNLKEKKYQKENSKNVWYLPLDIFWAPVAKIYFSRGDWTLDCVPMQFLDFAYFSTFPLILSLKSFGNVWGNLYIRFLILNTKFRSTRGEWNVYWNLVKFQVIIS